MSQLEIVGKGKLIHNAGTCESFRKAGESMFTLGTWEGSQCNVGQLSFLSSYAVGRREMAQNEGIVLQPIIH